MTDVARRLAVIAAPLWLAIYLGSLTLTATGHGATRIPTIIAATFKAATVALIAAGILLAADQIRRAR